MDNINISNKDKIFLFVDNKGTQEKFKDKNTWYKVNLLGAEGMAEHLTSIVLKNTKMPSTVCYVNYDVCKINGKNGCKSVNFLNEGESFISIQMLYKNLEGGEISEKVFSLPEKDRFDYVVSFVKENTGLDISEYLSACVSLDCLVLNPDRHYGNLGVIRRSDNTFKLAPIFDNGQGLGQNFQITPPSETYLKKKKNLFAATLCGSFEKAVQLSGGFAFSVNYEQLSKDLSKEPESMAKEFLINRLCELEPCINNSRSNPFTKNSLQFAQEEEEDPEYY